MVGWDTEAGTAVLSAVSVGSTFLLLVVYVLTVEELW